jgi:hypothetical protein
MEKLEALLFELSSDERMMILSNLSNEALKLSHLASEAGHDRDGDEPPPTEAQRRRADIQGLGGLVQGYPLREAHTFSPPIPGFRIHTL